MDRTGLAGNDRTQGGHTANKKGAGSVIPMVNGHVHGNVTTRCTYCGLFTREGSNKKAHLEHCHLVNSDNEPIIISEPSYPYDYDEFTGPSTQEERDGEELADPKDLLSNEKAHPDSKFALP